MGSQLAKWYRCQFFRLICRFNQSVYSYYCLVAWFIYSVWYSIVNHHDISLIMTSTRQKICWKLFLMLMDFVINLLHLCCKDSSFGIKSVLKNIALPLFLSSSLLVITHVKIRLFRDALCLLYPVRGDLSLPWFYTTYPKSNIISSRRFSWNYLDFNFSTLWTLSFLYI